MSGGTISYEIVSHTARELTRRFLRDVRRGKTTAFDVVSLDDPDSTQKPRTFQARVLTIHTGDPMIFDVEIIDTPNYWTRIEVFDGDPVRFDLII